MRTSVWSKRLTRVHRAMERRSAPGTSPPVSPPSWLQYTAKSMTVALNKFMVALISASGFVCEPCTPAPGPITCHVLHMKDHGTVVFVITFKNVKTYQENQKAAYLCL